jgi:putative SOS response-associated peptidase YedK
MAGEIHNRMSIILPLGLYEAWLDPAGDREELLSMLAPYPVEEM